MCQIKPCVVCPAPAAMCSTPAQLLQWRKGSPQQGSALQTVFHRLRSSSPPPAATTTALPSSTEKMTLRTIGSTREVALFRVCLRYASLNMMTCYIIVVFTYETPSQVQTNAETWVFKCLWGTYWGSNQYYLSTIWLISGVYYEFHVGCKQILKEPLSVFFN